jgi:hypothetical protein
MMPNEARSKVCDSVIPTEVEGLRAVSRRAAGDASPCETGRQSTVHDIRHSGLILDLIIIFETLRICPIALPGSFDTAASN